MRPPTFLIPLLLLSALSRPARAEETLAVPYNQNWKYLNPMGTNPANADADFESTWWLPENQFATEYNGPSFDVSSTGARREPGRLSYSTSGIATTNHIAMEDLLRRERAEMTHVPFRGAQEGVTALLGRQITMVADAQSWRPQVESGDFKLLSVWTRERLGGFPNAPTLMELGYDMVVTSSYGIVGPRGVPAEIVDILHRSFKKAWEDEASQAVVRRWDMPREYLGPADYVAFARERVEYEREWVRRLELTLD